MESQRESGEENYFGLHVEQINCQFLGGFTDGEFAADFRCACPFPFLVSLNASHSAFGDRSMVAFTKAAREGHLPNIVELQFDKSDISDLGLSLLGEVLRSGCLPQLQILSLCDVNATDDGYLNLASAIAAGQLANIVELCLGSRNLTDKGIGLLANAASVGDRANLPNLVHLDLGRALLTDSGMMALASAIRLDCMPKLRGMRIDLALNSVSHIGFEILDNSTRDRHPELTVFQYFSDESIGRLAEITERGIAINVCDISFSRRPRSRKCWNCLAKAIGSGRISNLRSLSLPGSTDDDALKEVACALSKVALPRLRNFEVGSNVITDEGLVAFANAARAAKWNTLECIDLYGNFTDVTIQSLMSVVRDGLLPSINQLIFNSGSLSNASATAIAEAISQGRLPNLRCLLIIGMEVNDQGMQCIAESASSGYLTRLEEIHFSHTSVALDGLKAVGQAVCNGQLPSLKLIEVSYANVSAVDASRLGLDAYGVNVSAGVRPLAGVDHLVADATLIDLSIRKFGKSRTAGSRNALPPERWISTLAILDTLLVWNKSDISLNELLNSDVLKEKRTALGLSPEGVRSTIDNHVDLLSRMCGLSKLWKPPRKGGKSLIVDGAIDALRRIRPRVEELCHGK